MKKFRIHWPAVVSALVTFAGIASSPAILALLPAKTALIVTAAGAVCQAVTKSVTKTDVSQ